jgi:hypothetical protein
VVVEDQYPVAGPGGAAEYVPGRVDQSFSALAHGGVREPAGGHHHNVGSQSEDVGGLGEAAASDGHSQVLRLLGQPVDDAGLLGVPWGAGGEDHLPTEPVGGLQQRHVVTT